MDVDSGKIYDGLTFEQLEELREFADLIEIHESDLTEKEKKEKQVDLSGNTRAAAYARNFRNMRSFVESKQKRKK